MDRAQISSALNMLHSFRGIEGLIETLALYKLHSFTGNEEVALNESFVVVGGKDWHLL